MTVTVAPQSAEQPALDTVAGSLLLEVAVVVCDLRTRGPHRAGSRSLCDLAAFRGVELRRWGSRAASEQTDGGAASHGSSRGVAISATRLLFSASSVGGGLLCGRLGGGSLVSVREEVRLRSGVDSREKAPES